MSLQFVMGPSGSGKSHYLYEEITRESMLHPEKNYIVLVPEQFTMQTQKDLVMASPRKGILNVDVLSFNRLAYRVFTETGEENQIVLSDVGKSFVLRKIAGNYEKDFKVLGGNLKKPGFIGEVKSVISEFTQYDIGPGDLETMMKKGGESTNFFYKLQDLSLIYQGFREYLEGKYITGEELLSLLSKSVSKSAFLKDSVVVLDGFTGFTPVQNKLLGQLLFVCEKIMVTVTTDSIRSKNPLFDLSRKTIDSLEKIARESHIEIKEPVTFFGGIPWRFREKEELGFLEAHLLRYSSQTYEKEPKSIRVFHAKTPREETVFVAQTIRRLVRKEGMRYRDIAVIASDLNTYANHVEKVFSDYHIPIFMDHKRSILLNSFVEYLRSLLAMAEQNFTYESVFRYLRTDLAGFDREEIDLLENYCVALGIRGYKKWQEKWIRKTKDMEEEELCRVNDIRQRFADNIKKVMDELKSRSKTVESITRALHEFFLENELQQKVKAYETMFAQAKELSLEKEYAQVYKIVMDLFDQFVELLGPEKLSLREYCDLLDVGLEEAKIGIIPPSMDQIVVGDIERTRIQNVKVLIFMGINDDFIPGNGGAGGLLSERDREKFEAENMGLAPGAKEQAFIQKFYLYLILTKPSQKVWLTYSRASAGGGALRPAYLIGSLKSLFPRLRAEEVPSSILGQELTPETGMDYLARGLQKREEGLPSSWQELYSWYVKDPQYKGKVHQMVSASFYRKEREVLSGETARELYGDLLSNSVSRLEKFSACAYAHFLAYGLRLKEREVYQFQAVDLGNLFHGAIERFSGKLEKNGYTWTALSAEQTDALIDESVEESVIDYGNTILYSSARNEYIITRLKRLMSRSIWALTRQLEAGDFIPKGYEISYHSDLIDLEDGSKMQLHGKIDRIDLCETDEKVYLKVMDYKTGSKAFDLNELYHGLQMQLVMYMNAAIELEQKKYPEKEVVPAGLFYYQVKDPLVGREEDLLKALCPDGVFCSSREVYSHLERDMRGQSQVLPGSCNKDGSLSEKSKSLSEEEFQVISSYAREKMKRIGNRIMEGESDPSPYELGDKCACTYCPYMGVCGFDEKIPGFSYRHLDKNDKKEALRKMGEEV